MRSVLVVALLIASVTAARAFSLDPGIASPNFQDYWKGRTLVMLDHHGGNLHRELRNVVKARKGGYRVVMGGWIKSAGTLWLGLPKSQFCIMLDAIFMFHQGSNGTRPASESHRRIYWNNLPRAVRNYITLQHVPAWKKPYPDTNLPWVDWIKVTGSQAVKAGFGRPCTADTKVNIFGGSHSDG